MRRWHLYLSFAVAELSDQQWEQLETETKQATDRFDPRPKDIDFNQGTNIVEMHFVTFASTKPLAEKVLVKIAEHYQATKLRRFEFTTDGPVMDE